MLNMCMLVGRLKEFIKRDNKIILILQISRTEKNKDGIYETDSIKCIVSKEKAEYINQYCAIDSIIGIKGQLQVIDNEMIVMVSKVTFLSSKEGAEKLSKDNNK